MADRESVITHLQIIHTWAKFARERDLKFFTAKHLEDIAQWADDALNLLKEQEPLAVFEGKVNKCVCGNEINRYWHPEYCGFCGKKLEWY